MTERPNHTNEATTRNPRSHATGGTGTDARDRTATGATTAAPQSRTAAGTHRTGGEA